MPQGHVLILAAGMPRSASTWMYNALRLLLAAHPQIAGDLGCGWIRDWNTIPKRKHLLIKLHDYEVQAVVLSRAVFYSYRDIRDAIASQCRKFGGTPDMLWADLFVHQHELWMRQAAYAMKYETMLRDRERIVADIAGILGTRGLVPLTASWNPDPACVVDELQQLSYESAGTKSGKYHMTNLYHPDHITDGRVGSWKGCLDDALAEAIAEKYRWWFDKYGYEIEPAECSVHAGEER